jgi:NAD(P)-dependent dehydrogenase (short-subunit alcohol dehydrogenase family)
MERSVSLHVVRSPGRVANSLTDRTRALRSWQRGLGAIESWSRGLALDLAPVRVKCVFPGLIHTEVLDMMIPEEHRDAQLLKMTDRYLLPRPGQPAEAAEAYPYLMWNGYATGQVVPVEGGIALAQ